MAESSMPSTYETTTTSQTTAIGFYPGYIKTIPGILKIVEIVLSLIVFICATVVPSFAYSGSGWASFVSMSAFILTLVLFLLYLTHVWYRIPGPTALIEFIYYIVYTVLYLIAAIVCAARGGWHASIAAAAFFAFAATAVYAVDTFFQFRAWRGGSTGGTTTTTTTSTIEKQ